MITSDPKPGYLTTEFWSTLLVHVITLVAFAFTLSGHVLQQDKYVAAVPSAAVIASALAQFAYSQARAKTKQAHVQAAVSSVESSGTTVLNAAKELDNTFTTHVDTVGSAGGSIPSAVGVGAPTAQPQPSVVPPTAGDPTAFSPVSVVAQTSVPPVATS